MEFQSFCLVVFLTVASGARRDVDPETLYTFPEGFKLGAATASYQVEGAWNEDGKTEFNGTERSKCGTNYASLTL
jgi:hypothetical protein